MRVPRPAARSAAASSSSRPARSFGTSCSATLQALHQQLHPLWFPHHSAVLPAPFPVVMGRCCRANGAPACLRMLPTPPTQLIPVATNHAAPRSTQSHRNFLARSLSTTRFLAAPTRPRGLQATTRAYANSAGARQQCVRRECVLCMGVVCVCVCACACACSVCVRVRVLGGVSYPVSVLEHIHGVPSLHTVRWMTVQYQIVSLQ